jgi:hypothetical protein
VEGDPVYNQDKAKALLPYAGRHALGPGARARMVGSHRVLTVFAGLACRYSIHTRPDASLHPRLHLRLHPRLHLVVSQCQQGRWVDFQDMARSQGNKGQLSLPEICV